MCAYEGRVTILDTLCLPVLLDNFQLDLIWFQKIKSIINLNYLSIFFPVTLCFVLVNTNSWDAE